MLAGVAMVLGATTAHAQAPAAHSNAAVAQPPGEGEFDPSQPDFAVINMPTTLRLPKYKSAFRLTHRFARPLGQGDFGDLAGDLFGFDSGAQIGLEFRVSLLSRSQVGIYRTSDRTIEFFGIEKRAGGHVFQLNVSNSIGTTPGQIARGGYDASDWYIGFNLSRKFF